MISQFFTCGLDLRLISTYPAASWRSGNLDDVLGLETLRSLHHVEADAVALAQGPEPLRYDGGMVDEDVGAALPHYEAKALVLVEPLHGALLSHTLAPCNK